MRRPTLVLICLVFAGCVSTRITRGSPMAERPATIAVLEFTSENPGHASAAADGCSEAVLEAGFRAVERRRVAEVMEEREESRGGEMGPEYYRQLGEMLGADAFVVGTSDVAGFGSPGGISARVISAATGDVVLMGSRGSGGGGTALDHGRDVCRDVLRALTGSD